MLAACIACGPDASKPLELLDGFPVIDVHQHIYNAHNFWYGDGDALFRHFYTPETHYDTLVQRMKENSVVLAIASGPLSAVDYFYTDYPENRSLFLYSAEFWKIEEKSLTRTVSDLCNAIKNHQVRSIGELCGIYEGVPLDDPAYLQLYALADSFSLPVFLHTGIANNYKDYPEYALAESNPANLKAVLEMYPDVNFSAARMGASSHKDYDFEDDVIEMMHTYDNFYVDIGSTTWINKSARRTAERFIRRAIKEGLEDKLLFGSNEMIWPDAVTASINYVKCARYLDKAQKKKILYWNAANYLKLSEREIAAHFGVCGNCKNLEQ